jgi:nicotinamidase/pyrazinamidase
VCFNKKTANQPADPPGLNKALLKGKSMFVEKEKTASFDVDPQRGFTPLCPKELPIAGGDEIAGELNEQANYATCRVVSKDQHPAEALWVTDDPNQVLTPVEGDYPNLDVKWPAHCVAGTEGNRLIPGLPDEDAYDLVVHKGVDPEKHPYGACYHDLASSESTGVIEWLRQRNIETVIVGGLATDYCMKTTALQLKAAGFKVIVNLGACRSVKPATLDADQTEMRRAGIYIIQSASELQSSP